MAKVVGCGLVLGHFLTKPAVSVSPYLLYTRLKHTDSNSHIHPDGKTHFGFETVSESEKESRVYEVFQNVAEKYDLMNDVMSGGIHRLWKDYFMEKLGPTPGMKLIDVAGGTGDIAFRFLQHIKTVEHGEDDLDLDHSDDHFDVKIPRHVVTYVYTEPDSTCNLSHDTEDVGGETNEDPRDQFRTQRFGVQGTHVTVCDINQAMLDVGEKRAHDLGYRDGISWQQGNAECLPMEDSSFDAYTIAFGIRNTTHIDKVLSEAHRVLKPGGRFMCLEFSEVGNSVLRKMYDEYSFQVIPVMGQLVAGDWNSYQYLVESIRKFPNQKAFSRMIRQAGFCAVTHEDLLFGVAAIHSGFKLYKDQKH